MVIQFEFFIFPFLFWILFQKYLLCCDWSQENPKEAVANSVTIDAFNWVQAAFGPFFVQENAAKIMAEMEAVEAEAWFHGYISRQTAEERLKVTHRELGTFLVRVSVTQANVPFVISYVGNTKTKAPAIHHLKITRPKWGSSTLVMDGVEYESLGAWYAFFLLHCFAFFCLTEIFVLLLIVSQSVAKGRERAILLSECGRDVPISGLFFNATYVFAGWSV